MALRLLLAARKSRKADLETDYERQDHRAKLWAEKEGHIIVAVAADTAKGTTAPWARRNLKPWMTQPKLLERYDAILISDTDRLSRGTDADFHYIEHWLYEHGKTLIVADGPWFPPRQGPMGESDRYQWVAQKRAARTYWEAVRDKHEDTRAIVKANHAAFGRPPFGYRLEGEKLHKRFVPDEVNGPLAIEAFQRLAKGRTATSVAIWLSEQTGKPWRTKRVQEMAEGRSHLGHRDGHDYEPLVSRELWEAANAAMAGRSFSNPGRTAVHGYSGCIYCQCGFVFYRFKSKTGREKYRCSRGRSGDLSLTRCGVPPLLFADVNQEVNAEMLDDHRPEWVMVTTGGDYSRQRELADLKALMKQAMDEGRMTELAALAADYSEAEKRPSQPIASVPRKTGRTIADAWETGSLADRRVMLGNVRVTVRLDDQGVIIASASDLQGFEDGSPDKE